jgi:hypothetical protein
MASGQQQHEPRPRADRQEAERGDDQEDRSLPLFAELERDARMRSYFGVYTVRDGPGYRELDHGSTVHGIQLRGLAAHPRVALDR